MGNTVSWLLGDNDKHHAHVDYRHDDEAVDLRAQGERYRQRAGEAKKRSQDLLAQSQVCTPTFTPGFGSAALEQS